MKDFPSDMLSTKLAITNLKNKLLTVFLYTYTKGCNFTFHEDKLFLFWSRKLASGTKTPENHYAEDSEFAK